MRLIYNMSYACGFLFGLFLIFALYQLTVFILWWYMPYGEANNVAGIIFLVLWLCMVAVKLYRHWTKKC